MKSYLVIFIILISNSLANAAEPLPLFIQNALAANPELKSSQSKWQMFVNKGKQSSALEDPMFMFKLQNLVARQPLSFGGSDPQTAKVIGISQQLPFWGKRGIRQELAQYEAESYRWQIEERKLELTRMIKEVWYQIWNTDKSLQVVEKNLKVLADFIAIAESRYSVGQGVQQDIFKAGLEKSKMLDMRISLQQKRRSMAANLNYLLSRPQETEVATISDFPLPTFSKTADQLNADAYQQRPQIKSLIQLANKSDAAHRLAQKESYPDFNLSFEYMFREASMSDPGYNMFTLGVTFNLPFQQEKRRAMQAESLSERTMVLDDLQALKNSISYTISDTIAWLEKRKQLIELYQKGIIPQAEQSLESAVISYRVGKVDFLTVLDGSMTLFSYERELYESQAEYMMGLARLEAAVGVELVSDLKTESKRQ